MPVLTINVLEGDKHTNKTFLNECPKQPFVHLLYSINSECRVASSIETVDIPPFFSALISPPSECQLQWVDIKRFRMACSCVSSGLNSILSSFAEYLMAWMLGDSDTSWAIAGGHP